ncbi:uncharacterized protein B0P05DRAFT_565365 [Gilbertella persicaria]|uniref:uncharacterized protein n=1 Tax=Gilbertella persicaria TaxID=101096 RepID=UPI00221E5BDE|nr:uncharacterized protein B0P05DRAFT_565365 [Gilbertella persicaria]KAI8047714.1 hypothetical protein B0P05DRAFT_565365 [Gilbertella persicaria]
MSSGTQSIADLTTETRPTTGDIPPPLVGASTIVAGNQLYVFGGRLVSSRQMTNNLYILNLETYTWTHYISPPDSPPPPRPRYFHSCNLYKHYLVVFGGMSYSVRRSSQSLCALDDVCLFNLETMTWKYPDVQPSIYAPQTRYAHLAVIATDKLVVMGGQDMSNQYINEINVFSLSTMDWVHGGPLTRQYGAYRAVAFYPNSIDNNNNIMATPPFWETDNKELSLCVYSNYNFTDVARDLQSFSPMHATAKFRDHSSCMSGSSLPPGLRFPSGDVIGHHLILTGTYLTPVHQSFHIWALNLANLVWVRIDTGSVLAHGSWNRGVLHEAKQQFIVFGDRNRELLEDYNHRQVNFTHLATVDLEAFGIYTYPKETCAPVAQELGLSMLNEPGMADIEIMTEDGRSIPANSNVIALRWPYFANLLQDKPDKPGFKRLLFPESYPVTLAFLQYIYTDHLMTAQQHHPQILSRLLVLSDVYNLPRLNKLATHALHQILTISTASLVYETSALTGKTALQIRALRVMINAKKIMQQQQQQQHHEYAGMDSSPVISSPFPSSVASSPNRLAHEEEDMYRTASPSTSTFRRLTASKSSTTSPESFMHSTSPSPKLSKSSTLAYQKPPLIQERQRKGSLVPLPSVLQQSMRKGSTPNPFDRPSMGIRF